MFSLLSLRATPIQDTLAARVWLELENITYIKGRAVGKEPRDELHLLQFSALTH